jgi:hypothetical protein
MSTLFRTLFEDSTVKGERMRAVSTRGLAEGHELNTCTPVRAAFHRISTDKGILQLEHYYYVKNILKIDSIHRLRCFYEL